MIAFRLDSLDPLEDFQDTLVDHLILESLVDDYFRFGKVHVDGCRCPSILSSLYLVALQVFSLDGAGHSGAEYFIEIVKAPSARAIGIVSANHRLILAEAAMFEQLLIIGAILFLYSLVVVTA